jgi:hypothetical protein
MVERRIWPIGDAANVPVLDRIPMDIIHVAVAMHMFGQQYLCVDGKPVLLPHLPQIRRLSGWINNGCLR